MAFCYGSLSRLIQRLCPNKAFHFLAVSNNVEYLIAQSNELHCFWSSQCYQAVIPSWLVPFVCHSLGNPWLCSHSHMVFWDRGVCILFWLEHGSHSYDLFDDLTLIWDKHCSITKTTTQVLISHPLPSFPSLSGNKAEDHLLPRWPQNCMNMLPANSHGLSSDPIN